MTTPQVTPSRKPDTYVLTISHRHGDDTTLHPTEEAARAALAEFARQWWHEIADYDGRAAPGVTGPPPDDDDEAIRIYFEHQDDESYTITPATMPRPGTPGRELADAAALDRIAEMLRDPDWGAGMFEDISGLVTQTGRSTETCSDDRPTWDRH